MHNIVSVGATLAAVILVAVVIAVTVVYRRSQNETTHAPATPAPVSADNHDNNTDAGPNPPDPDIVSPIRNNSVQVDDGYLIFQCPWCGMRIDVAQTDLNCRIFRHGWGLDPHSSWQAVQTVRTEREARGDDIGGCGFPFKIVDGDAGYLVMRGLWTD